MKKFLFAILSIIFLFSIRVYAYELTYSDWSTTYPEGLDEIFIESEDRYLWFKEQRVNEQYLPITNIGNRQVDYDDYIYSKESKPSTIKPEEIEGRIIKEISEASSYPENSIKKLVLDEYDFYDDVSISEIDIVNSFTGEKVFVSSSRDLSFLYDGDLDTYNKITDDIELVFDDLERIDDLIIKIYYTSLSNKSSLDFSLYSDDGHRLHYKKYYLDSDVIEVKKNEIESDYYLVVIKYTYSDKLYKVYEILREVTDDYYKEYAGYEKMESSKTTYYRYITNEAVLFDTEGNLVKDPNYCNKSNCYVVYVEKKEETPVEESENPQTIDNIQYYFLLLIASFVALIIIFRRKIYLVLSNRFKRE